MADNTLEMEARIKNYISSELHKIANDMVKVAETTKKKMGETGKAVDSTKVKLTDFQRSMKDATNIGKQMGDGLKTLITSFVGAQAIVTGFRMAVNAVANTMRNASKDFQAVYPDAPSVRRLEDAQRYFKGVSTELGSFIVPLQSKWLTLIKETMQKLGIEGDIKSQLVGKTRGEKVKALTDEIDKLDQKLVKLTSDQEVITEYGGSYWVPGLSFASEEVQDLLKRIDELMTKRDRLKFGGRGSDIHTGAVSVTTNDAYNAEAKRQEAELKAIRDGREAIEEYETAWEDAQYAKDQELLEQMRADREKRDQETAAEAQAVLDARAEFNDEYRQLVLDGYNRTYEGQLELVDLWETEQIALIEQKGRELAMAQEDIESARTAVTQEASLRRMDIAAAEAQAVTDSMSSMTSSILSIMESFVEDERAIAYTRAILGSAQALSSLIGLAVEESSSWYEALAKGLASAAEIVSLWAPIFADINSAATGGKFVTNGPQMLPGGLVVGDNPGGREEVTVRPLSSANTSTAQGSSGSYVFNFNGVNEDQFMRLMRRLERTGKIERVTMMGTV